MSGEYIDRAREEFREMKAAVRDQRRAFLAGPLSAFVRVMQAAIRQYLTARAEGVSHDDGVKGIEAELRDAWPVKTLTKFRPACGDCEDTGYLERTCWHEQRCGRERCAKLHPAWEHPYVVPCGCEKGARKVKRATVPDDAVVAVGRSQKRKSGWRQAGS